ncbi:hypothetical protein TURU_022859 [Turdus rufiventris]|nr:hypothetical protein TURU_022859 [Turdus rufiventris]
MARSEKEGVLNLGKVALKLRNYERKAQEGKKKVVLAGCVPQAQPRQEYLKGLSIIGVQQIDRVVEVVEETIKGHSVRLLGQKKDNGKRLGGARLDLPKIRKNPLIEIISINTGLNPDVCLIVRCVLYDGQSSDICEPGSVRRKPWGKPAGPQLPGGGGATAAGCLNACTYCKTKHARGDLASYPIEELVDRAKQSFQAEAEPNRNAWATLLVVGLVSDREWVMQLNLGCALRVLPELKL